jgi:hypothetical protein
MGVTFATSVGLEPTHQSEFAPESQNSFIQTIALPAAGLRIDCINMLANSKGYKVSLRSLKLIFPLDQHRHFANSQDDK